MSAQTDLGPNPHRQSFVAPIGGYRLSVRRHRVSTATLVKGFTVVLGLVAIAAALTLCAIVVGL